MLARCLFQQIRMSSSKSIFYRSSCLIRIENLKTNPFEQQQRKLSTNRLLLNENKEPKDDLNNYERLRERLRTKTSEERTNLKEFEDELSQLGLIQKFKKIVSEYWHVIIQVHIVTSTIWFAVMCLINYQLDLTPEPLIKKLQNYNIPEFIIKPLKNEYLQLVAVPFFLYKCVTPVRYYTTIYTTMRLIRYLMPKGIIKAKETPRIIQILYGKYKKPTGPKK